MLELFGFWISVFAGLATIAAGYLAWATTRQKLSIKVEAFEPTTDSDWPEYVIRISAENTGGKALNLQRAFILEVTDGHDGSGNPFNVVFGEGLGFPVFLEAGESWSENYLLFHPGWSSSGERKFKAGLQVGWKRKPQIVDASWRGGDFPVELEPETKKLRPAGVQPIGFVKI